MFKCSRAKSVLNLELAAILCKMKSGLVKQSKFQEITRRMFCKYCFLNYFFNTGFLYADTKS